MKKLNALVERGGDFARDQPFRLDAGLLALVVVHGLATQFRLIPNLWEGLAFADPQTDVQALYLGVLGAAAIVAGFAGVVVVFGLSAQSPRFQTFRATAGKTLARIWVASTLSGFEAVALCVAATVASLAGFGWLGPWLFELSLLFLLHGTVRLVWILRHLIKIVSADDIKAHVKSQQRPVAQLPFAKKNGTH